MRVAVIVMLAAGFAWGQKIPTEQAYREYQADVEKEAQAHLQALKAQLAAAQARLAELRATYTDGHPEVAAAQNSLVELQAQLADTQKRLARYKLLAAGGLIPGAPAAQSPKLPLPDRWWRNPLTVQFLALTADQQKKMDDVVAQFRMKLKTNALELQRQEAAMEPLVSAEPLDEAKASAQIDRVADARAELEKTNGRMLLGIRMLLTPDQWSKLNQAFTLNLTQK